MARSPSLIRLRDVLASLYSTEADARRVVDDAGISSVYIDFNNKAVNTWHNILSEADKRNKIQNIIETAMTDYPGHKELSEVAQSFLQASSARKPHDISPESSVPKPRETDVAALITLLEAHQRNLEVLKSQKAIYGLGEIPLRLLNQLEYEEQEIARILHSIDDAEAN